VPDLEACVETQARRRYNQLTSQLLGNSKENELAGKLELLRWFLETADLEKLRAESEKHLVEGRKVKFWLRLEDGKPNYEMKVH
jgi:hypothetical protein